MGNALQYFIDDYLRHLQYEKHYSAHTLTAYQKDLMLFQSFLHENANIADIIEVKPLHIRSWLAGMAQEGMSPATIKRKKSSLQSFFTYFMSQEKVKQNPAAVVPTPKLKKRLPKVVEQSAIDQLLAIDVDFTIEEDWNKINQKMLVRLLFETGIRRAELSNISEKDINVYRKSLLVFGKGGKERVIPIHSSMVEAITQYIRHKKINFPDIPSTRLFVTSTGKDIYDKYIYNMVNTFLDTVSEASKKSPHVLRHTFATALLNNGADISAIKDLLGHASLSATQIYTHTNIENLKKEFRKSHPRS